VKQEKILYLVLPSTPINECGKNKVTRISRQPFPVKLTMGQKQLENIEFFKHLGSILKKLLKMYL
jgi:hypothetical protein